MSAAAAGVPVVAAASLEAASPPPPLFSPSAHVVIVFKLNGCGHCADFLPKVRSLEGRAGMPPVVEIEITREPRVAHACEVQGYPTTLILREASRKEGNVTAEELFAWIRSIMSQTSESHRGGGAAERSSERSQSRRAEEEAREGGSKSESTSKSKSVRKEKAERSTERSQSRKAEEEAKSRSDRKSRGSRTSSATGTTVQPENAGDDY